MSPHFEQSVVQWFLVTFLFVAKWFKQDGFVKKHQTRTNDLEPIQRETLSISLIHELKRYPQMWPTQVFIFFISPVLSIFFSFNVGYCIYFFCIFFIFSAGYSFSLCWPVCRNLLFRLYFHPPPHMPHDQICSDFLLFLKYSLTIWSKREGTKF